jgi:hypothetical protein
MMVVNDRPACAELLMQRLDLIARQGRHAAAAGYALFTR